MQVHQPTWSRVSPVPQVGVTDPKRGRPLVKSVARSHDHYNPFTLEREPWFWIAGLVKEGAFTMLTTVPGEDIAPYHDRQIVVLRRDEGLAWLDLSRPEAELLRPLPAGRLHHERVR
jgi:putative SOS response-associated peptidase YedK